MKLKFFLILSVILMNPNSGLALTDQDFKPTDGEILGILSAADKAEVNSANFIKNRTDNQKIHNFAKEMVINHSHSSDKGVTLSLKTSIQPESTEKSKAIEDDGEEALAKLKGLKGNVLDRTYASQTVSNHKKVLNLIDDVLLPNASNLELKSYLRNLRATVAEHQRDAMKLRERWD